MSFEPSRTWVVSILDPETGDYANVPDRCLEAFAREGKKISEEFEAVLKDDGCGFGSPSDEPMPWESWHEDMEALSHRFPSRAFTLHAGISDFGHEEFRAVFVNGEEVDRQVACLPPINMAAVTRALALVGKKR